MDICLNFLTKIQQALLIDFGPQYIDSIPRPNHLFSAMLSRLKASSDKLGLFLGSCKTHSWRSLTLSVEVALCQNGVDNADCLSCNSRLAMNSAVLLRCSSLSLSSSFSRSSRSIVMRLARADIPYRSRYCET
jgi:hypothetical protein